MSVILVVVAALTGLIGAAFLSALSDIFKEEIRGRIVVPHDCHARGIALRVCLSGT